MNNYTVYCHLNKITGKRYIGQTCQNPEKRWGQDGKGYISCPKFWNAIQKYGWNNFEHIILFTKLSSEEADLIEMKLIQDFNTIEDGYNIKIGGKHYTQEEIVKMNLHLGLKERWQVEGRKEAYSKKMKQFYSSLSEEEKYHLYDNRRGLNHPASKRVVCRETGEVFNSLTEAAQWAGFKGRGGSNISAQIKGLKKSAGKHPKTGVPLHWYFEGEEEKASKIKKPKTNAKKVKNIETNLIFNSLTEAAQWCNGYNSNISKSCKSNGVTGGGRLPGNSKIILHWVYVD